MTTTFMYLILACLTIFLGSFLYNKVEKSHSERDHWAEVPIAICTVIITVYFLVNAGVCVKDTYDLKYGDKAPCPQTCNAPAR